MGPIGRALVLSRAENSKFKSPTSPVWMDMIVLPFGGNWHRPDDLDRPHSEHMLSIVANRLTRERNSKEITIIEARSRCRS